MLKKSFYYKKILVKYFFLMKVFCWMVLLGKNIFKPYVNFQTLTFDIFLWCDLWFYVYFILKKDASLFFIMLEVIVFCSKIFDKTPPLWQHALLYNNAAIFCFLLPRILLCFCCLVFPLFILTCVHTHVQQS